MGVPPTLVRVLVGRFGEVASPEAARSMSVEQVEAAHLEVELAAFVHVQHFFMAGHRRQSAIRRGGASSTSEQVIFKAREARAGSHLGACVEHRQREGRQASLWSPHGEAFY